MLSSGDSYILCNPALPVPETYPSEELPQYIWGILTFIWSAPSMTPITSSRSSLVTTPRFFIPRTEQNHEVHMVIFNIESTRSSWTSAFSALRPCLVGCGACLSRNDKLNRHLWGRTERKACTCNILYLKVNPRFGKSPAVLVDKAERFQQLNEWRDQMRCRIEVRVTARAVSENEHLAAWFTREQRHNLNSPTLVSYFSKIDLSHGCICHMGEQARFCFEYEVQYLKCTRYIFCSCSRCCLESMLAHELFAPRPPSAAQLPWSTSAPCSSGGMLNLCRSIRPTSLVTSELERPFAASLQKKLKEDPSLSWKGEGSNAG